MNRRQFFAGLAVAATTSRHALAAAPDRLGKIRDLVIHRDPSFYCIAPAIVARRAGELLVAFRRAPDRRVFGEKSVGHLDPNSQLVLVRSRDGGETWSRTPELLFAHPLGGAQDASLIRLADGSLVCHSYAWMRLLSTARSRPAPGFTSRDGHAFLGGYVLRSEDDGRSWQGPFSPPAMAHADAVDPQGRRIGLFNRGSMCQTADGTLYWAARSLTGSLAGGHYSLHLLRSRDRGETWDATGAQLADPAFTFTETSLIETPRGHLLGFVRARKLTPAAADGSRKRGAAVDDHVPVMVRSTDGGLTFEPWQTAGFFGYPFHALRLQDGRIWLSYGYRRRPFGVRVRILNPEGTDFAEAEEFVLRDDGGSTDVGYPWATLLPGSRVLTVYWINHDDGERYIAGTVCRPAARS